MAMRTALQLYTVREQAAANFDGTIRRVADMGYRYVEPAGFPGTTPEAARKLFDELGLTVCSIHGGIPAGDNAQQIIETAQMLGATCTISGGGPDDFKALDTIKALADRFNEGAQKAAEHGLTVGYHNHWWEFGQEVDGRTAYDVFAERLVPEVVSELDTYWAACGGKDAAGTITTLGERVKLLHIKDGPGRQGPPQTAVGAGVMDWAPIFKAATHAEYAIVELDECATDMMEAVRESYEYLTSAGLAVQ